MVISICVVGAVLGMSIHVGAREKEYKDSLELINLKLQIEIKKAQLNENYSNK